MATRTTVVKRTRGAGELLHERFAGHELLTYASALAFQVLKSLIPLTLFGLALLGAVGRQDVWTKHIAPALKSRLDPPVFHAIDFAVEKIFASNSAGLIAFSAVVTVWFVAGGVRAIMGAINRIYEVRDERPFWVRWPLSLGLALGRRRGWRGARDRYLDRRLARVPVIRDLVRELPDGRRAADRLPRLDGLCLRVLDRPACGDRDRRAPSRGRKLGRAWHSRRALRAWALSVSVWVSPRPVRDSAATTVGRTRWLTSPR